MLVDLASEGIVGHVTVVIADMEAHRAEAARIETAHGTATTTGIAAVTESNHHSCTRIEESLKSG